MFLRFVYTRLLDQFGLLLEDLGLGYFDVLGSSPGALMLGLGIPVWLVWNVFSLSRKPLRGSWQALSVMTAVFAGISFIVDGDLGVSSRFLSLIPLAALAVYLLWLRGRHRAGSRVLRGISVGAAMLMAATMASQAMALADLTGRNAHFGVATDEHRFLGMSFIGLRPTAARLRPLRPLPDRANGVLLPACPMYLAQHDGTVFVFDVATQKTFRLPASAIMVEISSESDSHSFRRCHRKYWITELAGPVDKNARRCIRNSFDEDRITLDTDRVKECLFKQLVSQNRTAKNRRGLQCLAETVASDPLRMFTRRLKTCLLRFTERQVKKLAKRDGAALNLRVLRRCLPETVHVSPIRLDKPRLAECVSKAMPHSRERS
jgi:hypothetical protein